jgi:hypothetical protein
MLMAVGLFPLLNWYVFYKLGKLSLQTSLRVNESSEKAQRWQDVSWGSKDYESSLI